MSIQQRTRTGTRIPRHLSEEHLCRLLSHSKEDKKLQDLHDVVTIISNTVFVLENSADFAGPRSIFTSVRSLCTPARLGCVPYPSGRRLCRFWRRAVNANQSRSMSWGSLQGLSLLVFHGSCAQLAIVLA